MSFFNSKYVSFFAALQFSFLLLKKSVKYKTYKTQIIRIWDILFSLHARKLEIDTRKHSISEFERKLMDHSNLWGFFCLFVCFCNLSKNSHLFSSGIYYCSLKQIVEDMKLFERKTECSFFSLSNTLLIYLVKIPQIFKKCLKMQ